VTQLSKSGSVQRSQSLSDSSSSASSQRSLKRHKLYSALTEEERGLFDELQNEIAQLRRLFIAESKVHIRCVYFMLS